MNLRTGLLFIAIACFAMSAPAMAAITNASIELSGSGAAGGSPVSGKVTLTWDSVLKELTVKVENTSGDSSVITAIFLMAGGNPPAAGDISSSDVTGSQDNSNWQIIAPAAFSPFADFEFAIDAKSPAPQTGIEAGEMATFVLSLPGVTFTDAADFLNDTQSDGWSVGLRIQQVFCNGACGDDINGDSAKLVGTGPDDVPEPMSLLLLGTGLLGIGLAGRKRRH